MLYDRTGDHTEQMTEKLAADPSGVPFLEGVFLSWEAAFLPIERD
ncbi:MAG: hypothetical protein AAGA56_24145 [Myxococcota bacterium]